LSTMNKGRNNVEFARGRVVVSQPVHQHAYETAIAAQQGGLLRCFVAGAYRTNRRLFSERFWRWTPPLLQRWIEGNLRRRWNPELDPRLVMTFPTYHLIAFAYRAVQSMPLLRRWNADRWAHERFDAAVGRWLRRGRPPAIVHAFEGSALCTLRTAKDIGAMTILDVPSAREYCVQVVLEEGGDISHFTSNSRLRAERELADYLFAPSEFVVRCLLEHGVSLEKIVLIPYGVNVEQFSPVCDREDGIFRVLYVGQIGLRKGVRYLLEAWRRQSLPNAELLLVGGADEDGRQILREYAGLYKWVGQVPKFEVDHWFRQSDLFVFPSLAEGSALVTYEAMASGLTVLTTANSGSVARDGIDGFIVPPRDIEALQEKIAFLYAHPELGREMGARARALIETRYTWRHWRENVRRAYEAILEGRDPKQAVEGVGAMPPSHAEEGGLSSGVSATRRVA